MIVHEPDGKIGSVRASQLLQRPQIVLQVQASDGHRCLRPDDEPRSPSLVRQLAVAMHGQLAIFRLPLLDPATRRLAPRRLELRLPPAASTSWRASSAGTRNKTRRSPQRRSRAAPMATPASTRTLIATATDCRRPGHPVDAEQRRPAGQGRIDQCVTQRQPGKTAQQPAAQPFQAAPTAPAAPANPGSPRALAKSDWPGSTSAAGIAAISAIRAACNTSVSHTGTSPNTCRQVYSQ